MPTAAKYPVDVTLKFVSAAQVIGIPAKDITRVVTIKDAEQVVRLDYPTTSATDSLTLFVYLGKTKIAILYVGIVKGVTGTGTGGR